MTSIIGLVMTEGGDLIALLAQPFQAHRPLPAYQT